MSGLAGYFFPSGAAPTADALRDAATRFTGPNESVDVLCGDDFGFMVASRFKPFDARSSFGEIVTNGRHVLAIEGYVTNAPELLDLPASVPPRMRGERLLQLFERLGPDGLERLDGGYTVAVWDTRERLGFLNACRYAQRVMHVQRAGGGVAFATEMKLLPDLSGRGLSLATDVRPHRWHVEAAEEEGAFARFGRTPFRDVERLTPGGLLTVSRDKIETRASARLARMLPTVACEPVSDGVALLDDLLGGAIARLMAVHDMRLVMMGGGLDSALIAAHLKRLGGALMILTEAFPGQRDESVEAARIATALEATHRVVPYTPHNLVEELEAFLRVVEEPEPWYQLGPPLMHLQDSVKGAVGAILTGLGADVLIAYANDRSPLDFLAARGWWRDTRICSHVSQVIGAETLCPYLDDELVHALLAWTPDLKRDKSASRRLLGRYLPSDAVPKFKRGYAADTMKWVYEHGAVDALIDRLSDRRLLERNVHEKLKVKRILDRYRAKVATSEDHHVLWEVLVFDTFCRIFTDQVRG